MSEPLPVYICGSRGRMGQTLIRMAASENAVIAGSGDVGDNPAATLSNARVMIDFSFHSATPEMAELCSERGLALVIGTTGHTEEEKERILACTQSIPIVWAGNYSIGVNTLFYLTGLAAKILGNRYQPEIMEIHHKHKKDAPSGTALNLAEALEQSGAFAKATRSYGREGETGERPDTEIGLHALRGGEVVGEHTVFLFADNERLELTHRASDRSIFASGAYRAAHWAVNQAPGLYNMQDVLGLKYPKEAPAS